MAPVKLVAPGTNNPDRQRTSGGRTHRPRRRRRRRRRNRRALVVLGVVVLVVVVTGVVLSQVDSAPSVSRTGSVKVAAKGEFAIGSADTYRVVYRNESFAGRDHVVTTDDLTVRRPFDSRLDSKTGPPPGKDDSSQTVSTFGLFSNK